MIDYYNRQPWLALLLIVLVCGSLAAQSSASVTRGLTCRFVRNNPRASLFQPVHGSSFDAGESNDANTPVRSARAFQWRNPLDDLGYAGKTMLSDVGYIYSSPARLNKRSLLWLGGIAAVGAVIYAYDQDIHDAFRRSRDDKFYEPIRRTGEEIQSTGYMGTTNKYYLGAILAGYLVGYKPMVTIPAEILEAQLIAGTFKDGANALVGRSRPFAGEGPYSFKFNDGTSFPSGHAKNVMIAANVISRRINFWPVTVTAYTLAGTVCLERVTSNAHWPSDVYFAAVYGWIISNSLIDRHNRSSLAVSPSTSNGSPGLSVRFSF